MSGTGFGPLQLQRSMPSNKFAQIDKSPIRVHEFRQFEQGAERIKSSLCPCTEVPPSVKDAEAVETDEIMVDEIHAARLSSEPKVQQGRYNYYVAFSPRHCMYINSAPPPFFFHFFSFYITALIYIIKRPRYSLPVM